MHLRLVIFADEPIGIGAGGIEVAQRDRSQAVRALEVRQGALDRQLGFAVGVDRPLRMVSSIGVADAARRTSRRSTRRRSASRRRRPSRRARHRAADVVVVVADRARVTDSPTRSQAAKCMTAVAPRSQHRGRRRGRGCRPSTSMRARPPEPPQSAAPRLRHGPAPGCRRRPRRDPASASAFDGVAADVARAAGDQDGAHGRPIEK